MFYIRKKTKRILVFILINPINNKLFIYYLGTLNLINYKFMENG